MKIISGGGGGVSGCIFLLATEVHHLFIFFSLVNIRVHPMLLFSRQISLFHSLIVGFFPKMNE